VAEVRFYADEHVPKAVVRGLRQRGIAIIGVQDGAGLGANDIEHMRLAHQDGRTIFTQDDDFLRLAAAGEPHAGIVYAAQHTSVRSMIQGLLLIHSVLKAEDLAGRIEFL